MADGYDRFDNEGGGGGSFVMGLLTGTVLGAGLGMLFAPKAGSELRNQLSEQAGNIANTASEGYRRAQESAGEWAEKGRGVYDKARDAVQRGADEAQRYVRDTTNSAGQPSTASAGGSSYGSSSSYGSGSESIRGTSTEQTRGGAGTSGSSSGTSSTHTGPSSTGSSGTGGSSTGGSRRS
jgi:gas vesicle protein